MAEQQNSSGAGKAAEGQRAVPHGALRERTVSSGTRGLDGYANWVSRANDSDKAVMRVADCYKRSNMLIGAKSRIDGLRLQATDVGWSTGAGPEVSGPLLSLLLAMTGRQAALAELSGDGLSQLAARMDR